MKKFLQEHIYVVLILVPVVVFVVGIEVGKAMIPQPVPRVTLREGGYHYINPILLCNIDSAPDANEDKNLSSKIQSYISTNSGDDISVYVLRIGKGRWAGVNINETYSPASMLKVPTMTAILKYAQSHTDFLSKEIYYDGSFDDNKAEFFKPQNTIQPGHSYTVDQLLTYMVSYSDNNATRLLSTSIDQSSLAEIYIDLGVQIPSTGNNVIDFMSVKTYALFLRLLYNSTYLTREMSEKALKLMTAPDFPQGLIGSLPTTTEVAQKFGERQIFNPDGTLRQRELHDCGIVYMPDNPYIMCVMTRGEDFSELASVMQGLSKLVYEYISDVKVPSNSL